MDTPDRFGGWMLTYSGGQIWPLDARVEEIKITDIAHALSQLCRYGGHSQKFYSVAEHCCHVSDAQDNQPDALWGLMHDASEAYLVDLPRPIKHSIGFEGYRAAERKLEIVIAERFKLPGNEMPILVREADNRILLNERDAIMAPSPFDWGLDLEPLPNVTIQCWSPAEAEAQFLARFLKLAPYL